MRQTTQAGKIMADESMMATPLLVMCVDAFGTEFFDWEVETFNVESQAHFGVEIPDVNRDKIWALVTVLTTDAFYKSLETFIPVCNALNGSIANFDDYDPVTSEEAAWGIIEVILNDPPEVELDKLFSHEIRYYVGLTLDGEGVTSPPRVLKPFIEYDKDPEEAVGASIGPDEALIAMHARRQKEENADITDYVRSRLALMTQQLQVLPLQAGSAAKIPALVQETQKVLIGLPTPETQVPAL